MLHIFTRHVIARLAIAVPTLLLVTFGSFVLLYAVGDPAAARAGEMATPEDVARIRHQYGFDRPITAQYMDWLGRFVRGDFGASLQDKGTVTYLVGQHLPPTLVLSAMAMLMAVTIALVVGAIVGTHPDGWLDRVLQRVTLLGIAVPNFLIALVLVMVFAIWIPLFPAVGYQPPSEVGWPATLNFLFLPSLALAVGLLCLQARTFRAALIEQYDTDYVQTARMKGLSELQVFFGHVFRNAATPLIIVIGLEIGVLITGSLLVEVVFAVPGIGTLTIESIRGQDIPVVQALVALFGVVVLAANFLADMVALSLDPRVRKGMA